MRTFPRVVATSLLLALLAGSLGASGTPSPASIYGSILTLGACVDPLVGPRMDVCYNPNDREYFAGYVGRSGFDQAILGQRIDAVTWELKGGAILINGTPEYGVPTSLAVAHATLPNRYLVAFTYADETGRWTFF